MKWAEADRALTQSGMRVFSDREYRSITGCTPASAKFQLIRYTRRGLLRRLKRGLYAVPTRLPSTWALANRLCQPSYISLESALSHYGMIPETVYAVTSVTTKSSREFETLGTSFQYRSIKRKAFTGYRSIEIDGQPVLLAEREKALADYLYLSYLTKTRLNSRLRAAGAGRRRVLEHLAAFRVPGLVEWFKHDLKNADLGTER